MPAGGSTLRCPGSTTARILARTGPARSAWSCGWSWRRLRGTPHSPRKTMRPSRWQLRQRALALGPRGWDDATVSDDRDTEFADALAEAGRRVGQAMTDALERIRPAVGALAEVANRPEIRAVIERAQKALRRRPCLCFCLRAHPADHPQLVFRLRAWCCVEGGPGPGCDRCGVCPGAGQPAGHVGRQALIGRRVTEAGGETVEAEAIGSDPPGGDRAAA